MRVSGRLRTVWKEQRLVRIERLRSAGVSNKRSPATATASRSARSHAAAAPVGREGPRQPPGRQCPPRSGRAGQGRTALPRLRQCTRLAVVGWPACRRSSRNTVRTRDPVHPPSIPIPPASRFAWWFHIRSRLVRQAARRRVQLRRVRPGSSPRLCRRRSSVSTASINPPGPLFRQVVKQNPPTQPALLL
jgi:hypothetical protein